MEASLERPLQTPRFNFEHRHAAALASRLLTDAEARQLVAAVDRINRTTHRYQKRRHAEQSIHAYFDAMLRTREGQFYYHDPKLFTYIEDMKDCRLRGTLGIKADGRPVFAWETKCNCLRLCPDEARQDQVRVIKQYVASILEGKRKGWRVYKLVLSPPNVPRGDLAKAKREAFAMWRAVCRKMRHKEVALAGIKGQLVIQEDPLGAAGDWNVHLNVILLYDGWLDYEKFRQLWPHVCDIKSEKDMREATRNTLRKRGISADDLSEEELLVHAIKECVKYPVQAISEKSLEHADCAGAWVDGEYQDMNGKATAPPMTEWPHGAAWEWWMSQKGFRRVRSYGCLYDCKRPERLNDLDDGTTWIATIRYTDDGVYITELPWLPEALQSSLLTSIRRGTSRQKMEGDSPPTGPPLGPEVEALMLQSAARAKFLGDYEQIYSEQHRDQITAAFVAAHQRDQERRFYQ